MSSARDDIVIGGMACRFPESADVEAFWRNLAANRDMVTENDDRWPREAHEAPARFGKLPRIERFDAEFFGVHARQAALMDPQLRMLLEVVQEALVDAGFAPQELRGSETGVFVGTCFSDAHAIFTEGARHITGYENTGCAPSMCANRVSFAFDFHGPSEVVDTACSSSLVALDAAVNALRSGRCDIAIVGATNIIFKPTVSEGFAALKMLSPDGQCRSFDASANGYARAEGIAAIVLTRPDRARRERACVLGTGVNSDGFTEQGITYPNGRAQQALLRHVYANAGVNPQDVVYIEAHGTGTPAGDPQEVEALANIFCGEGRERPLAIGSVKSNMGHSEAASGLAGIIKVLAAMEAGLLPANLHYNRPNPAIPALYDGRVEVVDHNRRWDGGIVGVNSFGFGGTNAHVILAGGPSPTAATTAEPLVVPVTARTREGLDRALNGLDHQTISPGLAGLATAVASTPARQHPYRGFVVHKARANVVRTEGRPAGTRPPIWFIFPGMGSQWPAMGGEAMAIPTFKATIEACAAALADTDIDVAALVAGEDPQALNRPCATQVAIVATQLAVVEVLRAAGVEPDGMIGHSVGEIGCAYADGALSLKEGIRVAYWRGRCIEDSPEAAGAMGVVFAPWEAVAERCPPGLVPACHNDAQSVTISGDAAALEAFAAQIEAAGESFRRVDSCGIAFHSPALRRAAARFAEQIAGELAEPRPRTQRWHSSARPIEPAGVSRVCDVEYLVDNMLNPVRFYEALTTVPSGAMVIEIGPHSLLRSTILATVPGARYVGMMRRDQDSRVQLLAGLGGIFVNGAEVNWAQLQPPTYPVRGVPRLHHLVSWDHTKEWPIPIFGGADKEKRGGGRYRVDLSDPDQAYLRDHAIHGKPLMPAVGYLDMVWSHVARVTGRTKSNCPVQFTDVRFVRATPLHEGHQNEFSIDYLPGTARFEVLEGGALVACGEVTIPTDKPPIGSPPPDTPLPLTGEDLYKELRLRGYGYGPAFRSVTACSLDGTHLRVRWDGNWVSFLDGLLHGAVLRHPRQTMVPTGVRRLRIDPRAQGAHGTDISAQFDAELACYRSDAVEISGPRFAPLPVAKAHDPALRQISGFRAYRENECLVRDGAQSVIDYIDLTRAYVLERFDQLVARVSAAGRPLPAHIQRIQRLLADVPREPVSRAALETFSAHPDASYLRLARHVYDEWETLLSDPMRAIVGAPEYSAIYRDDLAYGYFFAEPYLGVVADLVRDNAGTPGVLRVCELGAGTGGLTAHLMKHMNRRADRYVITDVSAGFFPALREKFDRYSEISDYVAWDMEQAAPEAARAPFDLITASNVLHAASDLRVALNNCHAALDEGGFLLLHETTQLAPVVLGVWGYLDQLWSYTDPENRTWGALLSVEKWTQVLEASGFDVVSVKDDGHMHALILARKRRTGVPRRITLRFTEDFATSLPELQARIETLGQDPQAQLWIYGDRRAPGLAGLVRCLRREPGSERIRTLIVPDSDDIPVSAVEEAERLDLAVNIVRDGTLGHEAHWPLPEAGAQILDSAELAIGSRGDLGSLHWINAQPMGNGARVYTAHYAGVNFKDVMLASGKLPPNAFEGPMATTLGGEFSGYSPHGERVMGYLPTAMATHMAVPADDERFIWRIPDRWTLEEAATVPVVYMTAYLALIVRARIRPGERVLIHAGAGGVGQAAIRVALARGCDVFTTVSEGKRAYLRELFPALAEDHIGNSRDTSFEAQFMRATEGTGMDVVLNSLAGDALQASVRLLGRGGRFLEIGKYDMSQNTPLGMECLLREISVYGVGLNNLMLGDPDQFEQVADLLRAGIRSGEVVPLRAEVFEHSQVAQAFRHMSTGKHRGKVVVRLCGEPPASCHPVQGDAVFWCHPERTYLITGGLGGFGLELADWLVQRGARHLVLTSRSGAHTGYQAYRRQTWEDLGVQVVVTQTDVSDAVAVESLIDAAEEMAPVGGIFHLAMVLGDALLANQTVKGFERACAGKLLGGRHLDAISRDRCHALEHFVVFSSVAGGFGNAGQTNYGYANVALERVCEQRRMEGLPALAIQWGAVGDVGFAHDNQQRVNLNGLGVEFQPIASCLSALSTFLCQTQPVVSSYVAASEIGQTLRGQEAGADDMSLETLTAKVKQILGLAPDVAVMGAIPLAELGVDSLMVVEIGSLLESRYDIHVPTNEVRKLTFDSIAALFAARQAHTSAESQRPPDQRSTVFECYQTGATDHHVTYFLSGFMTDGTGLLDAIDLPSEATIYVVHPERLGSLNDLAKHWAEHLASLPASVDQVRVVGHSIGATMAQWTAKQGVFAAATPAVHVTLIAPPNSEAFDPLRALSVEDLAAIPEEEGMAQLQRMPVYTEHAPLAYEDIKEQLRLIIAERLFEGELGKVDQIVLPADDPLCLAMDAARALATKVERVPGNHDLLTLDAGRWF